MIRMGPTVGIIN